MYKVLVAEDEAILREGVSEELTETGLFVVDTAINGQEALKLALDNRYDAMILDIRMPKVDGMELLKKLYEEKDEAIKVIMSGYTDFGYAKKGIEYGIADYVVKPLSPDGIRRMGKKLFTMIEAKEKKKQHLELLEAEVEDNRFALRDMMFYRIINGEYEGEAIAEMLAAQGIVLGDDGIYIVLVHHIGEVDGLLQDMGAYMFRITADIVALVLKTDEEPRAMERLLHELLAVSGEDAICAVGEEYSGVEHLQDAYITADEALKYALLLGKTGIIWYSDIKSNGSNIYLDEMEFRSLLGLLKEKELIRWVDRLFEDIPLNAARQDYYSLALYIAMLCQNNVRRLSAEKVSMVLNYENVLKARTLQKIKAWTFDVIATACREINENTWRRSALEVEKTKQYIEEHLSEDISMGRLAKNVYLSQNYLGRLFIEKIGLSISEYINRRRIERACELMRDGDALICEIADTVGIHDPNYFSLLFKKIMGIAPKEYKSRAAAQERVRNL